MVGGLFGGGLLLGLAFYIVRRRKQKARRGLQLASPSISQEEPWGTSGHGPYMTQVPASQHGAPSIVGPPLLFFANNLFTNRTRARVPPQLDSTWDPVFLALSYQYQQITPTFEDFYFYHAVDTYISLQIIHTLF